MNVCEEHVHNHGLLLLDSEDNDGQ
jgi:hypothetical protein